MPVKPAERDCAQALLQRHVVAEFGEIVVPPCDGGHAQSGFQVFRSSFYLRHVAPHLPAGSLSRNDGERRIGRNVGARLSPFFTGRG